MKADYTTPKDLFVTGKQYLVPLFQRAYAWGAKDWKKIWQNVLSLTELNDTRQHYIGAVVMYPTDVAPTGVNKYAVIDGQQRLTTIYLMLLALRDVAARLGFASLADQLADNHLLNKYAKQPTDRHRLIPNQTDRQSLAQLLTAAPGVAVEAGRIKEAYSFFETEFTRWINGQVEQAEQLAGLILGRLSMVYILLDANDNPHVVFESLNNSGVQLTQADLIRNYLFMRSSPDEQVELNQNYWQPMEQALDDKLTQFVWHYLMRRGGNVLRSDIYYAFRKEADARPVPQVLQELWRYAETYARILRPALETERPAVRRALERLHQTGLTVIYPLILRLYDQVRHGGAVTESTLLALLTVVENYAMRIHMARRGVGGTNKIMQTLAARTLGLDTHPDELLAEAHTYLADQNYPTDVDVRQALLERPLYHDKGERKDRTRFLLEALEHDLNPKEVVQVGNLSIEHIMPQTPTPAWEAELGPTAAADHAQLLHTLGNLTLTGYNPEMSNKPFAEKQKEFAKSNLALNAALAVAPRWDAAAIRARGEVLTRQALARWPSFAPEAQAPAIPVARALSVRPLAVVLAGQRHPVRTWIEVATATLAAAEVAAPGLRQRIAEARPRYLRREASELRTPVAVGEGWFYESHNSAEGHRLFCRYVLTQASIAETEWQVETADPAPSSLQT